MRVAFWTRFVSLLPWAGAGSSGRKRTRFDLPPAWWFHPPTHRMPVWGDFHKAIVATAVATVATQLRSYIVTNLNIFPNKKIFKFVTM